MNGLPFWALRVWAQGGEKCFLQIGFALAEENVTFQIHFEERSKIVRMSSMLYVLSLHNIIKADATRWLRTVYSGNRLHPPVVAASNSFCLVSVLRTSLIHAA